MHIEHIFSAMIDKSYKFFDIDGNEAKSSSLESLKIIGSIENKLSNSNPAFHAESFKDYTLFAIGCITNNRIKFFHIVKIYGTNLSNNETNKNIKYLLIDSYNNILKDIKEFSTNAYMLNYSIDEFISNLTPLTKEINIVIGDYLTNVCRSKTNQNTNHINKQMQKFKDLGVFALIFSLACGIFYLLSLQMNSTNLDGSPYMISLPSNEEKSTIVVISYPNGDYRILKIYHSGEVIEIPSDSVE